MKATALFCIASSSCIWPLPVQDHGVSTRRGACVARSQSGKKRSVANDNDVVIEAWNTVLFDKFCRFKHLLIDGLSPHSDAALERHRYPQGARVLDVGCGFGDSA